jgi:HK97 family phage prohead protease
MKTERRTLATDQAAVRASSSADGKRTIEGYAAVFYDGTPGTEYELWEGAKERILPGAFSKAVKSDDVRALFNHDPNHLLGRTTAGTLRLTEDSRGLGYSIDPPDTQAGRDTLVSLDRGDLSGSSFSFVVTDENWRKEDGIRIREIRGAKLFDVGPVTFPAYAGTAALARSADDVAAARAAFEQQEAAEAVDRQHRLEAIRRRARLVEITEREN